MKAKILTQKGAVLPLVTIGLLAILGTAGLAIDLGHGYLNKTRLQSALDAAALSGARTLQLTSKDTSIAGLHARDAFDAHLNGEMTSLSSGNLVLEFSNRLRPFTDGSANPNFIRVSYDNFATSFSFSSILPGVSESMDIGGTAVAGPIPVGTGDGELCNLAPVLMCGVPGDNDCSDGQCYGYDVGGEDCHVLKSGSGGNGMGGGGSEFGCEEDDTGIGPGNFQLARIDPNCPGGNCVRRALAGTHSSCLTASDTTVETEPGNTAGPTRQGLNTRFGVYQGAGLNATDYPPDLVTDQTIWHAQYETQTAAILASGTGVGVANRREITVPVVECDGTQNGQSTLDLLGHACFFLLEEVPGGSDAIITGQLIEGCESAGTPGTNPGTTDPSTGNWQIILYKDPNTAES